MEYHTSAAGFALGPERAQLNKDFTYSATQRVANQLETIDHVMMFTTPLPGPASGLPVLTDRQDTNASLDNRARAYLHTNCSQCHKPGGPTPSTMDLRYTTSLSNTNACDVVPLEGNVGIANERLIAPGDAAGSVLIERTTRRDSHGMPPLGSSLIDTVGVTSLSNWINGLANCNQVRIFAAEAAPTVLSGTIRGSSRLFGVTSPFSHERNALPSSILSCAT